MGISASSILGLAIGAPTNLIISSLGRRFANIGSYGIAVATAVIITNAGWLFTLLGDLIGKVVYIMVFSKIIYFVFEAVKAFKGKR